jgi:hypothetical protein
MPQKWKGGREAAQRRYKEKNREEINRKKRQAYQRNKKKERARQKKYRSENQDAVLAYNRKWIRNYRATVREEMLAAYGGKCACCGEAEPLFLELDHVFNDGARQRRKYGNQFCEWVALRRQGWPKGRHQILCANCNKGRALGGGECPHERGR